MKVKRYTKVVEDCKIVLVVGIAMIISTIVNAIEIHIKAGIDMLNSLIALVPLSVICLCVGALAIAYYFSDRKVYWVEE